MRERAYIAELFHPAAAETVSSLFTGHDFSNKKLSVIEIPSPKSIILIVQVHNSRSVVAPSQEPLNPFCPCPPSLKASSL